MSPLRRTLLAAAAVVAVSGTSAVAQAAPLSCKDLPPIAWENNFQVDLSVLGLVGVKEKAVSPSSSSTCPRSAGCTPRRCGTWSTRARERCSRCRRRWPPRSTRPRRTSRAWTTPTCAAEGPTGRWW